MVPERYPKWVTAASWTLVACVLLWVVSRGFFGPNRRLDARAILLGGICWAHGLSPYLPDVYSQAWEAVYKTVHPDSFVFAYPPTLAIVVVPLNLFGLGIALDLFDVLNLAALGATLCGCLWLMRSVHAGPWHDPHFALAVGLAAAVGPLSGTLLLGQTGLWALAAMLGLWVLPRDRWRALRVACVIVATTKPTLTLVVLCFVAVTEPALLALSAAVAGLLCTPILLTSGGLAVPGQWLHALQSYADAAANTPLQLASGQHLLSRLWPAAPVAILTVVAVLGGVLLGFQMRRSNRLRPAPGANVECLILLISLSAACLPLHSYDMILMAPLAAAIPFVRGTYPWYPTGVLLAARPAFVVRALEVAGLRIEHLDAVVTASGTVLMAVGVCSYFAVGRPLFATTRLPLRSAD